MYKLGLEKAEKPEIKLPTFVESQRKQGNFIKISTSASLSMLKPLTQWIKTNCGQFLKRWEYQTTLPSSCKNVYAGQVATVRTLNRTTDWIKIWKGVHKPEYCHPVYLTYIQSSVQFSSVSHAQLFATSWTAAHHASLSITNSQSLLKLTSIESVMSSNHTSSVVPFSFCLQSFPASGSFQISQFFPSGGQSIIVSASALVLPINIQD